MSNTTQKGCAIQSCKGDSRCLEHCPCDCHTKIMQEPAHSPTVTGTGRIYLEENASYEGVKKNGEPAGWYELPAHSEEEKMKCQCVRRLLCGVAIIDTSDCLFHQEQPAHSDTELTDSDLGTAKLVDHLLKDTEVFAAHSEVEKTVEEFKEIWPMNSDFGPTQYLMICKWLRAKVASLLPTPKVEKGCCRNGLRKAGAGTVPCFHPIPEVKKYPDGCTPTLCAGEGHTFLPGCERYNLTAGFGTPPTPEVKEASEHRAKIEKGAEDFANRFEGVMQELAEEEASVGEWTRPSSWQHTLKINYVDACKIVNSIRTIEAQALEKGRRERDAELLKQIRSEVEQAREYCASGCGCAALQDRGLYHEGNCVWTEHPARSAAIDDVLALPSLLTPPEGTKE